jgi:hypothetical protein
MSEGSEREIREQGLTKTLTPPRVILGAGDPTWRPQLQIDETPLQSWVGRGSAQLSQLRVGAAQWRLETNALVFIRAAVAHAAEEQGGGSS